MYWWEYHIGVLQKCREIPTVSIRSYLVAFLALVFVGATGLLTHSKRFHSIVTRTLGQAREWVMSGYTED